MNDTHISDEGEDSKSLREANQTLLRYLERAGWGREELALEEENRKLKEEIVLFVKDRQHVVAENQALQKTIVGLREVLLKLVNSLSTGITRYSEEVEEALTLAKQELEKK